MMATPEFERLVRPEPIVCADAVLNVAFERRDVAQMRRFAQDFGFHPVNAVGDTQYFRGHGDAPYLLSLCPSTRDVFSGFSFAARTAGDLEKFAQETGAAIESMQGPGGGRAVHLTDPEDLRDSLLCECGRADTSKTNTQAHSTPLNT